MRTEGISPKVYVPGIAQIIAGIVLALLFGLDKEGASVVGAGVGTLLLGGGANPGRVVPKAPKAEA